MHIQLYIRKVKNTQKKLEFLGKLEYTLLLLVIWRKIKIKVQGQTFS